MWVYWSRMDGMRMDGSRMDLRGPRLMEGRDPVEGSMEAAQGPEEDPEAIGPAKSHVGTRQADSGRPRTSQSMSTRSRN
jgi:hypothetical protein